MKGSENAGVLQISVCFKFFDTVMYVDGDASSNTNGCLLSILIKMSRELFFFSSLVV